MRIRTAAMLVAIASLGPTGGAWGQAGPNVISVTGVPPGMPPGGPVTIVQTLQLPRFLGSNVIVSGGVVPRHDHGHGHGHGHSHRPPGHGAQGGGPARGRGEHPRRPSDGHGPGLASATAAHHGPFVAVLVGPHGYSNVIVSGGAGRGWGWPDHHGAHRHDRRGGVRDSRVQAALPAPVLNGDGDGRGDAGGGSADGGSSAY